MGYRQAAEVQIALLAPSLVASEPGSEYRGRSTGTLIKVSTNMAFETSGMLNARKILAHHDMDHQYVCLNDTKGDGNCFYHALIDQLTIPRIRATVIIRDARDIPQNLLSLRQRIVDFARRSP